MSEWYEKLEDHCGYGHTKADPTDRTSYTATLRAQFWPEFTSLEGKTKPAHVNLSMWCADTGGDPMMFMTPNEFQAFVTGLVGITESPEFMALQFKEAVK